VSALVIAGAEQILNKEVDEKANKEIVEKLIKEL
jgi:F0F1-type ATP synthase membrane subunit b/b'